MIKQVLVTLGFLKEGLANLASAITSNGDEIIVPNPSYSYTLMVL